MNHFSMSLFDDWAPGFLDGLDIVELTDWSSTPHFQQEEVPGVVWKVIKSEKGLHFLGVYQQDLDGTSGKEEEAGGV